MTASADPSTGYYQAALPQGDYLMHVQADMHRPQEHPIHIDGAQQQDFSLEMLACLLLVDDDQNNPDVRSAYTQALDAMEVGYDLWNLSSAGDPTVDELAGYRHLIWFTGSPSYNTFNGANEVEVGDYLDNGGNLLLSSQSYLGEMGLTAFGQNYLHVASFVNNVGQSDLYGVNVFAGLGPFTLDPAHQNAADWVEPDGLGLVAFEGNTTHAAVSYSQSDLHTVTLSFALEGLPLADRTAVLLRSLEFFGGCLEQAAWQVYLPLLGK